MKSGQLWIVQLAEEISRRVAAHVSEWPGADRRRIGDQWKRAIDSVAANISEGHGRQHAKDSSRFYSIANGSLEETFTWLRIARAQRLIQPQAANRVAGLMIRLSQALRRFMKETTEG